MVCSFHNLLHLRNQILVYTMVRTYESKTFADLHNHLKVKIRTCQITLRISDHEKKNKFKKRGKWNFCTSQRKSLMGRVNAVPGILFLSLPQTKSVSVASLRELTRIFF